MKGGEYEERAVRYLEELGWEVLDRNFRCRGGEIDIVAKDGRELVFVEVKGGKNFDFGDPAERFNPRKLSRIIRCAYTFMEKRGLRSYFRVDLIIVRGEDIQHLRNVGFY